MDRQPLPYGRHSLTEADIEAVVAVLRSDWLTQGPAVPQFEEAVAAYCGARHAVAVSSGTAALHLACLAAGLTEGDLLLTSPITFVASANCARYCGARAGFVDIEPAFSTLDAGLLERRVEELAGRSAAPRIVVPVHFAGHPCDMERIGALRARYGLTVIEDACHALGASYRGERVGSGTHADMTVFSFHPVKSIATGEGGMILTNRDDLHERLQRLRSHGITRDPRLLERAPEGDWYHEQIELGFNYRMSDIQAALGRSQLRRLDEFIARRRQLARRYAALLGDLPLRLPAEHPEARSAWHLYVVRLDPAACPVPRAEVFRRLRTAGIGVQVHYIPVHTQPYHRRGAAEPARCPEAERHYAEALSLPLFPALTEEDQDRVAAAVRQALR